MRRMFTGLVLALPLVALAGDATPYTQTWELDQSQVTNNATPQIVRVSIQFVRNSPTSTNPNLETTAALVTIKGAATTKYRATLYVDIDFANEMSGEPYWAACGCDITTGNNGAGLNYAVGVNTMVNDHLNVAQIGWTWYVTLTDPATGNVLDRTPENFYPAP